MSYGILNVYICELLYTWVFIPMVFYAHENLSIRAFIHEHLPMGFCPLGFGSMGFCLAMNSLILWSYVLWGFIHMAFVHGLFFLWVFIFIDICSYGIFCILFLSNGFLSARLWSNRLLITYLKMVTDNLILWGYVLRLSYTWAFFHGLFSLLAFILIDLFIWDFCILFFV